MEAKNIDIGLYSDWIELSDHLPLICEIGNYESKFSDKHMTNYFFHLCIPLFIRVSNRATIEWE